VIVSAQRRSGLQALCLVLIGLGLAACNRTPEGEQAVAPPTLKLASEDVVVLGSETLANGPVVTGSIQAARRADLRAEVSAVVMQVLKENGDTVKRGDLLIRLDDTAIRDNLASTDEAVRAAQQTLTQAERQLQRLQTLRLSGMASMQQLDDTETRRNNATSELAAARSRQAQARQQSLRTEVRAPFDGIVSERKASVGDTAQLGKELLKVIDPTSLRFEGFVSADQIGQLRVGQEVRFRANGQGDSEFRGKIIRISPAANPTTRQIEVMVSITGKAHPAVAGLYAEGRIVTGTRALTIPSTALVRDGEKVYAWQIDGQKLRKVPMTLGERDPRRGSYVVNNGLKEGDRVLRHPNLTLRDDQAVELSQSPAGS
jgi:membrane fusion protein (multidrug efflux system)